MVQPDVDPSYWIHNYSEHTYRERFPLGGYDNSICSNCGKLMYGCWETVCSICGDTSCYEHSSIGGSSWLCVNCRNKIIVEMWFKGEIEWPNKEELK